MKLGLIAGSALAAIFFAAPAMAEVIHKTTWESSIAVNQEQVKCEAYQDWSSYVNMGKPRTRISVSLEQGELAHIPALRHYEATLVKNGTACPSLAEIVGEISPEGTANVIIHHELTKVALPTYGNCKNQRLDEKVVVKFKTGVTLISRSYHSLESNCGILN